MFAMMVLYTRTQRYVHMSLRGSTGIVKPLTTRAERLFVGGIVLFTSVLLFAPLLALLLRSLQVDGVLDFSNFAALTEKSRGFAVIHRALGNRSPTRCDLR